MNLLSYCGLTAVAAGAIALSSHLYLRYQKPFLRYLAKAIFFSYAFAFLDISGSFLTSGILAGLKPPARIIPVVQFASQLLAAPLLILAWYFFIRTILEMIGLNFRPLLRISYLTLLTGTFILCAIQSWKGLRGPAPASPAEAETIILLFNVLNRILIFGLWSWAYKAAAKFGERELASGMRWFSASYMASYFLYVVGALLFNDRGFVSYIYPILEFFVHLPPLIILWIFLYRYDKAYPAAPVKEEIWAAFFARHSISPREQDVIRLLLEGRSAGEIAEEVFVSLPTVKTNISNIYRKLGLKNRWQLITMIQNYSRQRQQQT